MNALKQKAFTGRKIIGLTGVYGSGKSTVAEIFEGLGVQRIDTDRLTDEAWQPGSPVYEKIRALFSKRFEWTENAAVNRKLVAGIVFHDTEARRLLEAAVHPYILDRVRQEVSASGKPVVLLEVPLLFEVGWDQNCDVTVAVSAPYETIRNRLIKKNIPEEDLRRRTAAQWLLPEKTKKADYVIDNGNSLDVTQKQVRDIYERIRQELKGE